MALTRKWSITLAGFFSIAMLAALLSLVGTTPTHAMSRNGEIHQAEVPDFNPEKLPEIDYTIWTTCHMCLNGFDGVPLVGTAFPADAQSDRDGRASGQTSLQLSDGVYQLAFQKVSEILRDAEQKPVGVVFSGKGSKGNSTFDFTYIAHQINKPCCAVEIHSPEIHPSGGVRFEATGTLRFE